jgi:hypothetical protein
MYGNTECSLGSCAGNSISQGGTANENLVTWLFAGNERAAIQPGAVSS